MLTVLTVLIVSSGSAEQALAASCDPVVNPYEGSVYEGIDLKRIRAEDINCPNARRVARKAHREALAMAPPPSGILRFKWQGWEVRGDLRGPSDKYDATRGEKRVFGVLSLIATAPSLGSLSGRGGPPGGRTSWPAQQPGFGR
jgi:hypothetical protein